MTELLASDPGPASSVELNEGATETNPLSHKAPEVEKPAEKPMSRQEAIAKAAAEATKDEPKEKAEVKAEKPAEKVEAKPVEKAPETQPAKADSVEKPAQESEKRPVPESRNNEAPARFLPKAKELWGNTPNPVKDEVHRFYQEVENERKANEVQSKEWESVKHYDQMAKANGTSIREALDNYTRVDKMLRTDPVNGIAEVLKIAGVTPQQYAQYVLGQSQDGQQQPQQQRGPAPEVQQLQSQVQQLTQALQSFQQEKVLENAHKTLVDPFKAEHPRFDELEQVMAQLINSGFVPQNLTPQQKMEAAYDMAERLSPRSMAISSETVDEVQTQREKSAAGKSIKGAPSPGMDVTGRAGQKLDRKAAIAAAMAQIGR